MNIMAIYTSFWRAIIVIVGRAVMEEAVMTAFFHGPIGSDSMSVLRFK